MKAQRRIGFYFLLAILTGASDAAFATPQDDAGDRLRDAFKACGAQLGLKPPQPEEGLPRFSIQQKAEMDSCLEREGVNLADLPPPPGPDMQKFHQAMRACMAAKGVNLPPPNFHEGPPQLSDAMRSAFEECRAAVQPELSSQGEAAH